MKSKTIQKKYKIFSTTMIMFIVLLGFAYSSAIVNATVSTDDVRKKNVQIQDFETEIAELEFEYFELLNSVNQDDAEQYGLVETPSISYVSLENDTKVAYNTINN